MAGKVTDQHAISMEESTEESTEVGEISTRDFQNAAEQEKINEAINYLKYSLYNEKKIIKKTGMQHVFCPRVPAILRKNINNKDYYDPKVVSFGPYHYNNPEGPKLMATEVKTKVAEIFLEKKGKLIVKLYLKVWELSDHYVRSCYETGSVDRYSNEELAMMMLQDGCFILVLIEACVGQNLDDEYRDLMKSAFVGVLGFEVLYTDMLLLENQIPFVVLNVLITDIYNGNEGIEMITKFLNFVHWGKIPKKVTILVDDQPPVNLLDLLKKHISKVVDPANSSQNASSDFTRYLQSFRSVSELKAKGIHFKPSDSRSLYSEEKENISISLRDVDFKSRFLYGELRLPLLIIGYDAKVYYSNLMAFEMCPKPGADLDFTVTSYIKFINSLVDTADDVKELRSKRVLLDELSSDEEVFKTLQEISTTYWLQDLNIYQEVRSKIEEHYNNKIKTWVAEIMHKYFSSPWSALGLFVAIAVTVLTFVQTYYSLYPDKHE